MEPKEIVQKGLQDRKDVRKAEARAREYRTAAYAEREARIQEQMFHNNDIARLKEEKARLEMLVMSQHGEIRRLRRERDARNKQERKTRQRKIIAVCLKCLCVFALLAAAHDLGWVVPWLVNCLLAASAAYTFCSVAALATKKK